MSSTSRKSSINCCVPLTPGFRDREQLTSGGHSHLPIGPFTINCAFLVTSLVPFPVSKWKNTHKMFNGKMWLFQLQWCKRFLVDSSLTKSFQSPRRNCVKYEKQCISFSKMFLRIFFRFFPQSLIPFRKNLDSKHTLFWMALLKWHDLYIGPNWGSWMATIYWEWPHSVYSMIDESRWGFLWFARGQKKMKNKTATWRWHRAYLLICSYEQIYCI